MVESSHTLAETGAPRLATHAEDVVRSKLLQDSLSAAPASKLERLEETTLEAVKEVPQAIVRTFEHPKQLIENGLISFALGFAAKTLLPEGGPLGSALAVGLGLHFGEQVAVPAYHAYKLSWNAKTMADIHESGRQLGDMAGSMLPNIPLGYLGYRAGAAAGAGLMGTSMMSGFAQGKSNFYDRANEKISTSIDSAADALKNVLGAGEGNFTGSHTVAQQYERIPSSLKRTLMGEDYTLPTVKLPTGTGEGVNVIIETGHGVEAPEFTEVYRALKESGANVKVATPDWMWKYQKPEGNFSLATWQENNYMAKADMMNSQAIELLKQGKVDAIYVPGGAGNTAALRTDGGVQELIKVAASMGKDIWTICHGAQVLISSHAFPEGTMITGSPDIRLEDLGNAGFKVDQNSPVVWDANHHLLSGQDPHVLNPFITALGTRLAAIKEMLKPNHRSS